MRFGADDETCKANDNVWPDKQDRDVAAIPKDSWSGRHSVAIVQFCAML